VKTDIVFHALGDTDELNSCIGVARFYCAKEGLKDLESRWIPSSEMRALMQEVLCSLKDIQGRLLDAGSTIATPANESDETKIRHVEFSAEHLSKLEALVDDFDARSPKLRVFILPVRFIQCLRIPLVTCEALVLC
jgi:cob(I)alamin adenosyltransferase